MPDNSPRSLVVVSRGRRTKLIKDNDDRMALSAVRYSMATSIMLWQAPVVAFGSAG